MTVSTHTLSVLVEDKPGVLARVASLFSRRGFNIQSLAVGATEQKNLSRMTIVVAVEDLPLEQVSKQLHKLVNVIKVVEQENENSVDRELALIKVRADAGTRGQVVEAVNLFRAKVIDVSTESLIIESTGTPEKLEALLQVLEPYGIREIVQSGRGVDDARPAQHHRQQVSVFAKSKQSTRKRNSLWQLRCSTTTMLTCRSSRVARSASSGTAAKGTRTR